MKLSSSNNNKVKVFDTEIYEYKLWTYNYYLSEHGNIDKKGIVYFANIDLGKDDEDTFKIHQESLDNEFVGTTVNNLVLDIVYYMILIPQHAELQALS